MDTKTPLASYVENNNFIGLQDSIARKLRLLDSDSTDQEVCMMIRLLSEFGLFLLRLEEHSFHEVLIRDHIFKMAQRIDAIMTHDVDVRTVFLNVISKISNYAFKTEYGAKKNLSNLEEINIYIDES